MFAIHNVNLVHRFMGCILKEKKIKTMESRIECIVIWLRWSIAGWIPDLENFMYLFLIKGSAKDLLQV